jgi:hypothetical protein
MAKRPPLYIIIFGLIAIAFLMQFFLDLKQADPYIISFDNKIMGRIPQTHYDMLFFAVANFFFCFLYYFIFRKYPNLLKKSILIHCYLSLPFKIDFILMNIDYNHSIAILNSFIIKTGQFSLLLFVISSIAGSYNAFVGLGTLLPITHKKSE